MATRIAVMSQGRVIQLATPREVYHRPVSRFLAEHPVPCKRHQEFGDCELEVLGEKLGLLKKIVPTSEAAQARPSHGHEPVAARQAGQGGRILEVREQRPPLFAAEIRERGETASRRWTGAGTPAAAAGTAGRPG